MEVQGEKLHAEKTKMADDISHANPDGDCDKETRTENEDAPTSTTPRNSPVEAQEENNNSADGKEDKDVDKEDETEVGKKGPDGTSVAIDSPSTTKVIATGITVKKQQKAKVQNPSSSNSKMKRNPPTTMKSSGESQQLKDIETPEDTDVLSGRGNFVNYHPGNLMFREKVQKHKLAYVACPKPQKSGFAELIVAELRGQGSRFLVRDETTKLWHDIGDKKALMKTRQALREGAPDIAERMTTPRSIGASAMPVHRHRPVGAARVSNAHATLLALAERGGEAEAEKLSTSAGGKRKVTESLDQTSADSKKLKMLADSNAPGTNTGFQAIREVPETEVTAGALSVLSDAASVRGGVPGMPHPYAAAMYPFHTQQASGPFAQFAAAQFGTAAPHGLLLHHPDPRLAAAEARLAAAEARLAAAAAVDPRLLSSLPGAGLPGAAPSPAALAALYPYAAIAPPPGSFSAQQQHSWALLAAATRQRHDLQETYPATSTNTNERPSASDTPSSEMAI